MLMLDTCLTVASAARAEDAADCGKLIAIDDGDPNTDDRAWAVNSVNVPSCKNYALYTSNGYQFASYYGGDKRLNIARRCLPKSPERWENPAHEVCFL